jgi:glycosyltransferase involved in cell wall biosynthesis
MRHKTVFRFLPNSNQLAKKLSSNLKKYKISPLLNGMLHNGFEKILIEPPGDNIRVLKEKIMNRPTIVQVGALDENKNHLFSLDCLEAIKKRVPEVLLLIIGDGCKMDRLRRYARDHSLGGHVFFSGELKRRDCFHLIYASDLLILTSKSESFPNVLIEAQFLELPVVSFDVGDAAEIIVDEETGYIVPKNQKEQFVERTARLLLDKSLAKRFGNTGKQRIIQNFTMHRKVENFLQLLKSDLKTAGLH